MSSMLATALRHGRLQRACYKWWGNKISRLYMHVILYTVLKKGNEKGSRDTVVATSAKMS
jgi:hypothetical protein